MRILCWFSCGASSAVATKKTLELYHDSDVVPVCCDTRPSEDSDNYRFSSECEKWFGVPITYIRSEQYATIDDVFQKTRYMSGVGGARCTTELKKIPRLRFALPDDSNVFGFTAEESDRANNFALRNPDMKLMWPLIDRGITKEDCYLELSKAGIRFPRMYQLGFDHNNCPGCVKATSPWYWQRIREHYPEVFSRRCVQSRDIGCRLVRLNGERIFLDELPDQEYPNQGTENISCGPECGIQMKLL